MLCFTTENVKYYDLAEQVNEQFLICFGSMILISSETFCQLYNRTANFALLKTSRLSGNSYQNREKKLVNESGERQVSHRLGLKVECKMWDKKFFLT